MKFHHRAVPIVLAAVLIDSIGFGIVLPVLPKLIQTLTHESLPDVTRMGTYMLTAFSLAQFVAAPVLGSLGDSVGRRPVLLFSMLAFAADYAFQAAAPTIAWLFVGRVIAGIAGATYGPANAVLADVTPPEKRGEVFGLMGAAFGVGFVLGPALGGLLSFLGPRAPFAAAAALALLNAAWIFFLLPETMKAETRRPFEWRKANLFGAFEPLRHAGQAKWLLAAAFLWQFAHMVYPATWAYWAEIALHWDERMIAGSLAASGAAMALAQMLVTGRAIKRWGEERTVVIGMLAGGLAFLAYVFARETWMIFTIIVLAALQGLVFPSMNALLSKLTDASHQGALMGGMQSLSSIAWILSPLAMGQALAGGAEHGFTGGNFALAAVLVFVALLLVALKVVPRVHAVEAEAQPAG
ncbi:MFS transporter [Sphingomonas sp.]|uniref:MFS transporter n=1 Tax=Sphingomonas sp. TaxID=28214 RepID=UPI001B1CCDC7|nr:MFS transporter [Sphingomonas sp.]MBO9711841.1 MFS transporter [Sphingomonas sp.]